MTSTPAHAVEHIESISIAFTKGTTLRRRQLHRKVIMKSSSWCLIAFQAQDWMESTQEWQPPFIVLNRYKRKAGKWRKHSGVTLRGNQAIRCLETVATWDALAETMSSVGIDIGDAVAEAERGAASPSP